MTTLADQPFIHSAICTRAAMNILSLFWYSNVFLASGYSFNVCTYSESEHVKLYLQ